MLSHRLQRLSGFCLVLNPKGSQPLAPSLKELRVSSGGWGVMGRAGSLRRLQGTFFWFVAFG